MGGVTFITTAVLVLVLIGGLYVWMLWQEHRLLKPSGFLDVDFAALIGQWESELRRSLRGLSSRHMARELRPLMVRLVPGDAAAGDPWTLSIGSRDSAVDSASTAPILAADRERARQSRDCGQHEFESGGDAETPASTTPKI